MNTPPKEQREALDREWTLQESALDAEREGAPVEGDARSQRYRAVARALREPIVPDLPADFAKQVAQKALWRDGNLFDGGFERWFAIALFALLAIVTLYHLGDIVTALAATPSGRVLANSWVLAAVACVGTSAGMQWWMRGRLG